MIGFLFFLALQPILRKPECRVNLRYVQMVYTQLQSETQNYYTLQSAPKICSELFSKYEA